MSKEGWRYATEGGEAYLCHRDSGAIVNITKSSNGWFRFVPFDGSRHRICWSGGSVDNQDFPQGSASTLASLKAGGGMEIPESLVFGSWTIGKENQLRTVRNKDSSSQCLYLTCVGFVFLTQAKNKTAVIVENGKESIETLEHGRQALLAASDKVESKVMPHKFQLCRTNCTWYAHKK
jgi:hypothetical protein